jgi:hypothetical protein
VLCVTLDGTFVERVHLGDLASSTGGGDVVRDGVERRSRRARQEHSRPFAGERARYCTAESAARPIDHSVLVFE